MTPIYIKRGDTFLLSCVYALDGQPAQLPPLIRAQLRDSGDGLVSELTVTVTDASKGEYTISASADETKNWKLEVLVGDIQYTDIAGNVSSTETFEVNVLQDVTRD